jgi:hydrogenase maturation factor HypF (carbamoyltransferase family)
MTKMDHEKQKRLEKVKKDRSNQVVLSSSEFEKIKHSLFNRTMKCSDCNSEIVKITRAEHIRRAHQIMICKECGLEYMGSENLSLHFERSCLKRMEKCKYCNRDFVGLGNLREHQNNECLKKCAICNSELPGELNLATHVNSHCTDTGRCPLIDIRPQHYKEWHHMSVCTECGTWVYGKRGHTCNISNVYRPYGGFH